MTDIHAAGARHVISPLMRESLMDKALIARTESPVRAILPSLNVIQIGGLSIMDRGHTALMPLLDEIVANQETHTQVVGVGPGVRARHMLSVGLAVYPNHVEDPADLFTSADQALLRAKRLGKNRVELASTDE